MDHNYGCFRNNKFRGLVQKEKFNTLFNVQLCQLNLSQYRYCLNAVPEVGLLNVENRELLEYRTIRVYLTTAGRRKLKLGTNAF